MRVQICNLEARVHADVQMMHQLSRLTLYLKMEPFSQMLCFSMHISNTNVTRIGGRDPSDFFRVYEIFHSSSRVL